MNKEGTMRFGYVRVALADENQLLERVSSKEHPCTSADHAAW